VITDIQANPALQHDTPQLPPVYEEQADVSLQKEANGARVRHIILAPQLAQLIYHIIPQMQTPMRGHSEIHPFSIQFQGGRGERSSLCPLQLIGCYRGFQFIKARSDARDFRKYRQE